MIDFLKVRAKANAIKDRTGWARWYDVCVAYYPRSRRYSYFLKPYGHTNRRDLEAYVTRMIER